MLPAACAVKIVCWAWRKDAFRRIWRQGGYGWVFDFITGVQTKAGSSLFRFIDLLLFLLIAKSRVQTSLASIRAGWFSTALVCSPVAPEFHPPPRQTSGQRTAPQAARLACPRNPRNRLRHRSARPIHRSFPPAKFRRSAALIGATNAPLKFSAALRPSSPHSSRQGVNAALLQPDS